MQLTCIKPYASITDFDSVSLPDFTVLTGVNGAGKTHLLKAIEVGNVKIEGINPKRVKYFSNLDFFVTNEFTGDVKYSDHDRKMIADDAWGTFVATRGSAAKDYHGSHLPEDTVNAHKLIERELPPNTSVWIAKDDLSYSEKVRNAAKTCCEYWDNISSTSVFSNIVRKIGRPPYDVTEQEFREAYDQYFFSDNYLATRLADICTRYLRDQYRSAIQKMVDHGENKTQAQSDEEFEQENKKPWELVNDALSTVRKHIEGDLSFNFKVKIPNSRPNQSNIDRFKCVPKILDIDSEQERRPEDLSSGEKILFALAISVFECRNDFALPEVMLLDEIDASLHPSMILALRAIIEKVFLPRKTKVILATQSPSTVALAPKDSVWEIYKDKYENKSKIEQIKTNKAVGFLSEGFVSLTSGKAFFDQIANCKIGLISEGNNSRYIQHFFRLHEVKDVGVIEGMESVTCKGKLKTFFEFLREAPLTKPLLFVWDCDAKESLQDIESRGTKFVRPFILPVNHENKFCSRGIENMFSSELIKPFLLETEGDIKAKNLDCVLKSKKKECEEYVLEKATLDDFSKFNVLIDEINELRRLL